MYNSNFASKNFLILLGLIITVFAILIVKAFDFVPDENIKEKESVPVVTQQNVNNQNLVQNSEEEVVGDSVDIQEENSTELEDSLNVDLTTSVDSDFLDKIPTVDENYTKQTDVVIEKESNILLKFEEAQKKTLEQEYSDALTLYNEIINMSAQKDDIAKAYEGVAVVNACQKRYGSALAIAQKAYNMSPSVSRELLIARLYYKTGHLDKATERINNILKRDFLSDR